MSDDNMGFFYSIFEAMPRQGPGDRASTLRALALLPPLSPDQRLLDIGSGSGAQTLDLARACEARITAIDNHPAFVERLAASVAEAGLADRVTAEVGDMTALRFGDASFDVIWAEGAIFIIGFARGLAAWRRLLVPGGHLVVSELCWTGDARPEEVAAFFADEGADIASVSERRAQVADEGYELLADFPLPAVGWWDNYYRPLAELVARFRAEHAADPEALALAASLEREIDVYRRYPDSYGYTFFVMRRAARD